MDAAGRKRKDHITRLHLTVINEFGLVHNADTEARQIVVIRSHDTGVLGSLTADERAAGLHTTLSHTGNQCSDLFRLISANGNVVQEKQRLCPAADNIVDTHGHAVDTHGVMLVHALCDADLGTHAVSSGNQNRLGYSGKLWGKQSPEAADIGDNAGDHGTGNVLFHELDALIAGLDIHAGVTVAVRITTHMLFSLSQFAILSGRSHGGHSFPVQQ